ncbi:hypothetical protein [Streptomyces venezuelae]|uniref:hypothetical protein n=1 Tax=Streptomyces venezuelae TaxID=54571 RepID=UPI001685D9B6|nr:hypothetical protein [Streptomyces venezuelae]
MSTCPPELVADVDEVFLGWWDDEVMAIVREPYTVGAITAYARRDGGAYIPSDDEDGAS